MEKLAASEAGLLILNPASIDHFFVTLSWGGRRFSAVVTHRKSAVNFNDACVREAASTEGTRAVDNDVIRIV